MKPAPLPIDEAERLQELVRYHIMDTEEEKDYNDFVQLAADICNCPVSSITFIDANRQWFKASKNMPDKETSRDISFCSHAILQKDVMVVENALTDKRFHDYPNVTGGIKIRFYAGAPITSQKGKNLGTLCVIDTRARSLTKSQEHALQTMAGMVSRLLELRINAKHLVDTSSKLLKSAISYKELFEFTGVAQWIYDLTAHQFITANKAAIELYGYTEEEFSKLSVKDLADAKLPDIEAPFNMVTVHKRKNGEQLMVDATLSVIKEKGNHLMVASIIDLSEKLKLQQAVIEEKKQSAEQVESARANERNYLGKELHDNICQMLSSTNIYLDLAYAEDDIRMELIKKSQDNVLSAINQVRNLSRRLVNSPTKGINLQEEIHTILDPYQLSEAFNIHYIVEGEINSLSEEMKTNLLRIVQEALHNIVKYAEAKNVWVSVIKDKKTTLTIKDDGKGFEAKKTPGIGLKNMKDRAKELSGKLKIQSSVGAGTEISVVI
jgi:PAS domain S-box-containing protein